MHPSSRRKTSEMTPSTGQDGYRRLGLVFVVFGLIAFVLSTLLRVPTLAGVGLGAFLVGLLLIYLPTSSPTLSADLVGEAFMPAMANLESLLAALGLGGSATYMPPDNETGRLRLYVPLTENQSPPQPGEPSDFFIMSDGNPGRLGIMLEPPGSALLAMVERESQQNFAEVDLTEVEEALRSGMVESLELLSSVHLGSEGERFRFFAEGDVLWKFTEKLAKQTPNVCQKIGCPFCSLAACALAKSSRRNVNFLKAEHFNESHAATLQLM
jgi:hypothetical protein